MSEDKRPQFGARFLTEEENVFKHNAWDDVEWSEDQLQEAKKLVERNSEVKLPDEKKSHYESEASGYWDVFYNVHENRFFKDRNWLFTELPELSSTLEDSDEPRSLLEIGCGAGNTVFPILESIRNPDFRLYCCDFSPKAVELVRSHPDYNEKRCEAFVCDVTKDWEGQAPAQLTPGSLDMVLMIFTLSAMNPQAMTAAVQQAAKYLKPGGLLFFRDYGEHDLAQLRFKSGKCIDKNFYVRGDGTRCYFFTTECVRDLFGAAGLVEKDFKIDRRLQVNRGKQLKMYRIWMQWKYIKPL